MTHTKMVQPSLQVNLLPVPQIGCRWVLDQLSESTSEGGRIRANKSHLPSRAECTTLKSHILHSRTARALRNCTKGLAVLREIHREQRVVPQLKGIGRHGSVSGCGYKRQATLAARTTPPRTRITDLLTHPAACSLGHSVEAGGLGLSVAIPTT